MLAIAKRIMKQIIHDKRSLALIIVAPFILLTLIYFLLGESNYKPEIALDKNAAEAALGSVLEEKFENALAENGDIKFSILPEGVDTHEYIEDTETDAVITFDGQNIRIVMLEPIVEKISIVTEAMKNAADEMKIGNEVGLKYLAGNSSSSPMEGAVSDAVPIIAMELGTAPAAFENALAQDSGIMLLDIEPDEDLSEFINHGTAHAVVVFSPEGIEITMYQMNVVITPLVTNAIRQAAATIDIGGDLDVAFIYGSESETTFDSLAYYMLNVISFFLIFIFAGISFVRERISNTLERLMCTPVSSYSVVAGYTLGFGFFAGIQSILTILFAKFVLKTPFAGQWWLAVLIMLMIAFVAIMLGIFVSVISTTEFQVVQFIPLMVVPQIFFSGLIPVDMLPFHLDIISYFLPLYYSGVALKHVMVYGYGFDKVWMHMFILLGFIMLLFAVNVGVVQKNRNA